MSNSGQADPNDVVAFLEVTSAHSTLSEFPIVVGDFQIGSGSQCQLQFNDADMPEVHTLLAASQEDVLLSCRETAPELLVNGQVKKVCRLSAGDRIQLGQHQMVFRNSSEGSHMGDHERPKVETRIRREPPAGSDSRIAIWVLVAFGLVLVGIVGYFVYMKFDRDNDMKVIPVLSAPETGNSNDGTDWQDAAAITVDIGDRSVNISPGEETGKYKVQIKFTKNGSRKQFVFKEDGFEGIWLRTPRFMNGYKLNASREALWISGQWKGDGFNVENDQDNELFVPIPREPKVRVESNWSAVDVWQTKKSNDTLDETAKQMLLHLFQNPSDTLKGQLVDLGMKADDAGRLELQNSTTFEQLSEALEKRRTFVTLSKSKGFQSKLNWVAHGWSSPKYLIPITDNFDVFTDELKVTTSGGAQLVSLEYASLKEDYQPRNVSIKYKERLNELAIGVVQRVKDILTGWSNRDATFKLYAQLLPASVLNPSQEDPDKAAADLATLSSLCIALQEVEFLETEEALRTNPDYHRSYAYAYLVLDCVELLKIIGKLETPLTADADGVLPSLGLSKQSVLDTIVAMRKKLLLTVFRGRKYIVQSISTGGQHQGGARYVLSDASSQSKQVGDRSVTILFFYALWKCSDSATSGDKITDLDDLVQLDRANIDTELEERYGRQLMEEVKEVDAEKVNDALSAIAKFVGDGYRNGALEVEYLPSSSPRPTLLGGYTMVKSWESVLKNEVRAKRFLTEFEPLSDAYQAKARSVFGYKSDFSSWHFYNLMYLARTAEVLGSDLKLRDVGQTDNPQFEALFELVNANYSRNPENIKADNYSREFFTIGLHTLYLAAQNTPDFAATEQQASQ